MASTQKRIGEEEEEGEEKFKDLGGEEEWPIKKETLLLHRKRRRRGRTQSGVLSLPPLPFFLAQMKYVAEPGDGARRGKRRRPTAAAAAIGEKERGKEKSDRMEERGRGKDSFFLARRDGTEDEGEAAGVASFPFPSSIANWRKEEMKIRKDEEEEEAGEEACETR